VGRVGVELETPGGPAQQRVENGELWDEALAAGDPGRVELEDGVAVGDVLTGTVSLIQWCGRFDPIRVSWPAANVSMQSPTMNRPLLCWMRWISYWGW
jgi:hypothetical protein